MYNTVVLAESVAVRIEKFFSTKWPEIPRDRLTLGYRVRYRDLSPKQYGGGYRLQYTYFSNLAARTRLLEPPLRFQCSCPGVGAPGNKGNMLYEIRGLQIKSGFVLVLIPQTASRTIEMNSL